MALQVLHRVDLPDRQRHEQQPDHHRQRDDRPRPRQADRAVAASRGRAGGCPRAARAARRGSRAITGRASGPGVVDAAAAPRVTAEQPPAGEDRAAHEPVAGAARRARTASRWGGTCSGRPRARRASSGRRRRDRCPRTQVPSARTSRCAFPRISSTRSRSQSNPRALGRLGEAGPDDEHVVVILRQPGRARSEELAQAALDPVADDGRPDAFGTASPSRGRPLRPRAGTSRGPGSASRRTGPAGRRRRSRASARGGGGDSRARPAARRERRLRPFARRRLRIARPARVDMRARKPCLACACARWADRSVSRGSKREEEPPDRGRRKASIDEPQRVVPQLWRQRKGANCSDSRTGRPNVASRHRRPQVWRQMWNRENPCKSSFFVPRCTSEPVVEIGLARCYARRSPVPRPTGEELAGGVEPQIELTAESLWSEVSSRLRGALNETTYRTWFDRRRRRPADR